MSRRAVSWLLLPRDVAFASSAHPVERCVIFVVKTFGQIGEICQALYTEAFTSFCNTFDGAMCSDPPPLPAGTIHGVEDRTVFFLFPDRLLANLLLDLSCLFGMALRPSRSCLSMPPGNLATLEAGVICVPNNWQFNL